MYLRGQGQQIYDNRFFMKPSHLGPSFICWSMSQFRGDMERVQKLRISLTPRSQAQRCNTLSGVIDTTESSSTVFLTPRCQAQRCYWHQGFKLSGVINTAESSSAVLLTPWSQVHLSYWHLKLSGVTVVSSSAVPRCQCLYKVKNVALNLIFHWFFPI